MRSVARDQMRKGIRIQPTITAMTSNVPVSLTASSMASQPSRKAKDAATNRDNRTTATCGPIRFGLMITMSPRSD